MTSVKRMTHSSRTGARRLSVVRPEPASLRARDLSQRDRLARDHCDGVRLTTPWEYDGPVVEPLAGRRTESGYAVSRLCGTGSKDRSAASVAAFVLLARTARTGVVAA